MIGDIFMGKCRTGRSILAGLGALYQLSVIKRCFTIWLGFQVILWVVFAISYIINKDAWVNVIEVNSATAAVGGWWSTLLFIIGSNLIICILITVGNLFVRFKVITPGLLILVAQGIMIGWLAGANGFEVPFINVTAANMQYLRIGLWETTAYSLVCGVTLTKSLLISETFPPKKWSQTRKLKDIKLSITEIIILLISSIMLIVAAIIETYSIIG
jgi:hypothetical protein